MKTILPYLPALALCALLAWVSKAPAVVRTPSQATTVVRPVTDVPFAIASSSTTTTADETVATGSITAGSSSTPILNADADRTALFFQNAGTNDFFCCLGSSCSSTTYDFLLQGGERLALQGFSAWAGALSCASPGGGSFAASRMCVGSGCLSPRPAPACDPALEPPPDPNGVWFCNPSGQWQLACAAGICTGNSGSCLDGPSTPFCFVPGG